MSPPTLYHLSGIYKEGVDGIVRQSNSRAINLMEEAANLGYSGAQYTLAGIYLNRSSGAEDQQKAALCITLAHR